MSKILFFNFDGTCNEPKDAQQGIDFLTGDIDDSNISNILKFHLLLGGNPMNGVTELRDGNLSFYYRGVGTYGNFIEKGFNMILGHEDHDIRDILMDAMDDFNKYYNSDVDKIILTGFSRGGALARKFASKINDYDKVPDNSIIEAIFDTVARVAGDEEEGIKYNPSLDIKFNNQQVASKVEKALHIVSLDEIRKSFRPTLMTEEDKILEIWFPGGHSDIGGGYRQDGLSDNSLCFFLDWLEDLDLNIKLLLPKEILYEDLLFVDGMKNLIKKDDLEIDPDPTDIRHQSKVPPIYDRKRQCRVISKNGETTDKLPIIHHSVIDRISKLRDYRPIALGEIDKYKVYYDKKRIIEYSGLSDHIYSTGKHLVVLDETKTSHTLEIMSRKKYNHTGIYFEKGKTYRIEVVGEGTWSDASISNDDVRKGLGWDRESVKKGLKEFIFKFKEDNRRVPEAKWFELCGTIKEDDSKAFRIGNSQDYSSEYNGEFCAFANDLDKAYGNNTGRLKIKLTLLTK